MKSGLFVLYLAAGFIFECNATTTIIWNLKDKTINKPALCKDGYCPVVANHDIIITVTWFFEGTIRNPHVTVNDDCGILHGSRYTDVYYLCKPRRGPGIAIMTKECKFTLNGGNYTFDLPALKAQNKVGARGDITIIPSNGGSFFNIIVITK